MTPWVLYARRNIVASKTRNEKIKTVSQNVSALAAIFNKQLGFDISLVH